MKLGRGILKALGISLLPVLPLERIADAATDCGLWFLCGIYGIN